MLSPDMTDPPRRRGKPPSAVKIEVSNLDFYYGQSKALKDITLPLHERSVTAFIGPSGCGKSTLLRVLNRIYELYPEQRAEGEVLLDGENILDRAQDLNLLRAKSAWCSRSRRRFRCRSTTTSPSASGSMRSSAEVRDRRPRRSRR